MVKYLKYIVLIFGGIGIIAVSFFYLQNKTDIAQAFEYKGRIDYDYLNKNCKLIEKDYLFPCIKKEYEDYLNHVSLTGTSIGLKMVFNVMDEDRARTTYFSSEEIKQLHFSINYIEINNLALQNAYKRYFGFKNLYGGFVSSLEQYYGKAYEFNDNLILGLESADGIKKLKSDEEVQILKNRLESAKNDYYRIKNEVQLHLESEFGKLEAQL
ncbi:MAG: hypothetical protein ACJAS4_002144 [Bacteriovoracaceae bacterium]|jgi:hypothetical protein